MKEKKYVHMLNATLCATERTLCCIMENYQEPDGVRVPKVLVPYVGTDFLPYKKEKIEEFVKAKQSEAAKAKKGADKTAKKKEKAAAKEEAPAKEEESKEAPKAD